ncbi:RNA polymerase sigma factor [bacterium]|nr:RNA polymerase sigma factor [bacterium]
MTKAPGPDLKAHELVARLVAGDERAWEEFMERYRRLIFGAIHRVNGRYGAGWDGIEMEELFSDAIFKLLRQNARALAAWEERCKFETWIYRIVRNVCIDRLRRATRRGEIREVDEERPDPARQERVGADQRAVADLRLTLDQAIDEVLEPREALAVRLIYFEGHTYRDVAAGLGMSVGAVSGMVYRALAKLRQVEGIGRGAMEDRS